MNSAPFAVAVLPALTSSTRIGVAPIDACHGNPCRAEETTSRAASVSRLTTAIASMFAALIVAGGLSLANLVLGVRRNLNLLAFALVIVAVAFGGSHVPVGDFPDHTPYIGLDWFILDLLGSTLVFVAIEKRD